MARLSEYPLDRALTGDDRVLGTDSANNHRVVNFSIEDFSEFVRRTIFPVMNSGALYTNINGSFIESFIRNDITTDVYTTAYIATDTTVDLSKAIYLSSANTITVGGGVPGVFNSALLVNGVRIVLENRITGVRLIVNVLSFDSNARTITLRENVDDITPFDGTTIARGVASLTFVRNDGINLDLSFTTTDGIREGTTNLYYTDARVSANTSVVANTAKVGVTQNLLDDVSANTAKVGVTQPLLDEVAANTAKVGVTQTLLDDVAANTAKTGITTQQAADIVTNNAKVGVTPEQATDITTNNAKVSNIDETPSLTETGGNLTATGGITAVSFTGDGAMLSGVLAGATEIVGVLPATHNLGNVFFARNNQTITLTPAVIDAVLETAGGNTLTFTDIAGNNVQTSAGETFWNPEISVGRDTTVPLLTAAANAGTNLYFRSPGEIDWTLFGSVHPTTNLNGNQRRLRIMTTNAQIANIVIGDEIGYEMTPAVTQNVNAGFYMSDGTNLWNLNATQI